MLKTERLILRPARQSDLSDLFAIYGNADAMKYWSTAPHASAEVTQKKLDKQIAEAEKRIIYFVIEKDGRVIGQCGMHAVNEYGFILHPDFWRQGIISEASAAIIPYLFETNDFDHIIADADPRNIASISALKGLGFVETHRAKNTFYINDVWSDSVYLKLMRSSV